jgi:hypothetical protein
VRSCPFAVLGDPLDGNDHRCMMSSSCGPRSFKGRVRQSLRISHQLHFRRQALWRGIARCDSSSRCTPPSGWPRSPGASKHPLLIIAISLRSRSDGDSVPSSDDSKTEESPSFVALPKNRNLPMVSLQLRSGNLLINSRFCLAFHPMSC